MSEREIQNDIQKEHSRGATRLLRINCGAAWQGQVIDQTPARLVLSPWYPVKLAAEGVSDLLGWTTVEITADMVGTKVAVLTAVEVKDRGKPTPEQLSFLHLVRRSGGRGGVARSVAEAGAIIRGLDHTSENILPVL